MPTVEISYKDLCSLIGRDIPLKELKEEAILFAKGEVEEVKGDLLKVDIKDTNRPDLWSAEGIAREIKARYTKSGMPEYTVGTSGVVVKVSRKVKGVRPYTVCAVVKNLNITEDVLSQMIQLQEKVAATFGRGRREVAIGVYDLNKIKPPISYTTVKPEAIKFIPLGFTEKMTPKEILEKHPKGREFGHLLKGKSEYPIFIDSEKNVLSIPPVINSDYTGKVTVATRDVFIECSGFNFRFLMPALNVLVSSLADRGGRLQSVKVVYTDKTITTPDLMPKRFSINHSYVNEVSGLNLSKREIIRLLESSNYRTKTKGDNIELLYPAYRQDIMHPKDVVEDVTISYGYNRIRPVIPKLPTTGKADEFHLFSEDLSEIMIGLGFQEILSYILTNKDNLFRKMKAPDRRTVEIENPISTNWCVFRTWLLPSLMEFLSRNRHIDFPQKIFETGDCVVPDNTKETRTRDIKKIAAAISDNRAGYENISSVLDSFLRATGVACKLKAHNYPWLIKGRSASVLLDGKEIGFIGELHPDVLSSWNLDRPSAVFELQLEEIFRKV
jgi:phenylalanyl-tRNA synthetase beta chain